MDQSYFMVVFLLPETLSEQFISLVPKNRIYANQLLSEGNLTSYSLSRDQSKLWAIFNAKTISEVEQIITGFPLFPYMKYEITPLLFHNLASEWVVPKMSLN